MNLDTYDNNLNDVQRTFLKNELDKVTGQENISPRALALDNTVDEIIAGTSNTGYRNIKEAQVLLDMMGFDIGAEGVDGYAGRGYETWNAISKFKTMLGIGSDGTVDQSDIDIMKEVLLDSYKTIKLEDGSEVGMNEQSNQFEDDMNGVYDFTLNIQHISQIEDPGKHSQEEFDNIYKYGCALSSVSMVLNFYGANTNPYELYEKQKKLLEMQKDSDASNDAVYAMWDLLPSLANIGGDVSYQEDSGMDNYLSEKEVLDRVLASLNNGVPAIVRIGYDTDGEHGTHFVVVYGVQGKGTELADFLVRDPARSTDAANAYKITLETAIMKTNGRAGVTNARIDRFLIYSKN